MSCNCTCPKSFITLTLEKMAHILGSVSGSVLDAVKITRALLSVSDKAGLIPFATFLSSQGIEILSTGGTAKAMREAGLTVTDGKILKIVLKIIVLGNNLHLVSFNTFRRMNFS